MSKHIRAYRGSLDGYYQVEQDDGSFGPVYSAGNLIDFSINPEVDSLDVISTRNADYGQAADSMADPKPTKIPFSVNRFNIDHWAMAFMGEVSKRTASQKTITDEVVHARVGEMAKLANLDISSLVLNHTSGSPTYTAGADYEIVDAELAIIRFPATSSIPDDTDIHADYTAAAESGYLLEGGRKTSRFIKFWGRGLNRFNNKRCIIHIGRAAVVSSGAFSFVGTDAAEMGMEMTANVPADGSAAYTIITDE